MQFLTRKGGRDKQHSTIMRRQTSTTRNGQQALSFYGLDNPLLARRCNTTTHLVLNYVFEEVGPSILLSEENTAAATTTPELVVTDAQLGAERERREREREGEVSFTPTLGGGHAGNKGRSEACLGGAATAPSVPMHLLRDLLFDALDSVDTLSGLRSFGQAHLQATLNVLEVLTRHAIPPPTVQELVEGMQRGDTVSRSLHDDRSWNGGREGRSVAGCVQISRSSSISSGGGGGGDVCIGSRLLLSPGMLSKLLLRNNPAVNRPEQQQHQQQQQQHQRHQLINAISSAQGTTNRSNAPSLLVSNAGAGFPIYAAVSSLIIFDRNANALFTPAATTTTTTTTTACTDDNQSDAKPDFAEESSATTASPPVPIAVGLVVDSMTRCCHFLTLPHIQSQVTVLGILCIGAVRLLKYRASLLPLVHSMWPTLTQRLRAACAVVLRSGACTRAVRARPSINQHQQQQQQRLSLDILRDTDPPVSAATSTPTHSKLLDPSAAKDDETRSTSGGAVSRVLLDLENISPGPLSGGKDSVLSFGTSRAAGPRFYSSDMYRSGGVKHGDDKYSEQQQQGQQSKLLIIPLMDLFTILAVVATDFMAIKFEEELLPLIKILLVEFLVEETVSVSALPSSSPPPRSGARAGARAGLPSSSSSSQSRFTSVGKIKHAVLRFLLQLCAIPPLRTCLLQEVRVLLWLCFPLLTSTQVVRDF